MLTVSSHGRRSWTRGWTWILVAGAVVVACVWLAAGVTRAVAASKKPVLTVGVLPGDVGNLNPAMNNAQLLNSIAYQSLIHVSPTGTEEPDLASSWRYVGKGNKVFELTLVHNAHFSDGSPVTAAAVKTWLNYFMTAPGNPHGDPFPKGATVSTVGKWTVKITLATPNPNMPWMLGENGNMGFVASPTAVANPTSLSTATAGAGPYILQPSQTVANSTYTYTPNPHYFEKKQIQYSKVIVKVIPTATAMLQALQAGQIDVGHGDFSTAAGAKSAGLQVIAAPAQTDELIFLDMSGATAKALANPSVRRALNYAIDRKAITKALFGKYATPAAEIGSADGNSSRYTDYYPYDPAKAKSLLASAGYPNGFTFSVITQAASSGNAWLPAAEALASNLQAVGVTLNIVTEPTGAAWTSALVSHNYSATMSAGGFAPTWLFTLAVFANPSVYNQHGWSDAKMTAIENKAAVSADPQPLYQAIMGKSTTDAVAIPIAYIDTIWYAKKNVGGVSAPGTAQGVPNLQEWYTK